MRESREHSKREKETKKFHYKLTLYFHHFEQFESVKKQNQSLKIIIATKYIKIKPDYSTKPTVKDAGKDKQYTASYIYMHLCDM